jgi:hypothetical protein
LFSLDANFGIFDIVAFLLTLVGLYLAWIQAAHAKRAAVKAQDAAEAVETAVSQTEHKLAQNTLMGVLASVQQVIRDLEHAAEAQNKDVAQYCLIRFGLVAMEAAQLLDSHGTEEGELASDLKRLSETALSTKATLARRDAQKTHATTAEVRQLLGVMNLQVTASITSIRISTGASNNA